MRTLRWSSKNLCNLECKCFWKSITLNLTYKKLIRVYTLIKHRISTCHYRIVTKSPNQQRVKGRQLSIESIIGLVSIYVFLYLKINLWERSVHCQYLYLNSRGQCVNGHGLVFYNEPAFLVEENIVIKS